MQEFLAFVSRLVAASLHYRLSVDRPDALMVSVRVPGELWEIEFTADGAVEVERLRSDGSIGDSAALDDLFENHAD